MKAIQIVLGLVLTGLVAPAFANGGQGNDVINSGFGNDIMEAPLAVPAGLKAAPSADAGSRTHRPIEFTTRLDGMFPLATPGELAVAPPRPSAASGGYGTGKVVVQDLNFSHIGQSDHMSKPKEIVVVGSKIKEPKAALPPALAGAAALPQPAAGGARQGQTLVFYLGGIPAARTALTGAASGRPAESLSFNYSKIDYKYIPLAANGPAVGAMAARR